MIDHLTIVVSDYERSKAFYLAALAPLGYVEVMELSREQIPRRPVDKTIGLGVGGKPDLWLRPSSDPIVPTHIASRADDRSVVDAFFAAALQAEGKDNGAPGLRPHYPARYCGAFVLDPDGYNLQAVCHDELGLRRVGVSGGAQRGAGRRARREATAGIVGRWPNSAQEVDRSGVAWLFMTAYRATSVPRPRTPTLGRFPPS